MGIAEVIPGVSGSTLALIMGIYDDFINFLHQISDLIKEVIRFIIRRSSLRDLKISFLNIDWKFGIFLLLGMAISLALFSHIISYLLETQTPYVYAFFFGLVIASIAIPFSAMKERSLFNFSIIFATFAIFFTILGMDPIDSPESNPIFLFIAGALAICAMVLPGVSGSFIFLLLGVYDYVIGLIKNLTKLTISTNELVNLFAVGLGIVFGFSLFVRLLKIGLQNRPSEIMAFLIGLMLASLRALWPFMNETYISQPPEYTKVLPWEMSTDRLLLTIFFIVIAALIVLLLKRYSKPDNFDAVENEPKRNILKSIRNFRN